jgi:hypothetical protein
MRVCRVVHKIKADAKAGYQGKKKKSKPAKAKADDEEMEGIELAEVSSPDKGKGRGIREIYIIFMGTESAKVKKSTLRELNATVPVVPQYLN